MVDNYVGYRAILAAARSSEIERANRRADRNFTIVWALGLLLVLSIAYVVGRGIFGTTPKQRLLREATLLRERIRYSTTQREAAEVGAQGGRWLVGRFQTSRERELVERPTTLSSLIHDFRALAERAAAIAGVVVVAIDELDKMADAEKVRALLRDIKGVFDVTGVCFLVSVSDEAARALHLGSLSERNEFNSSFYTVLELAALSPDECADLIAARTGDEHTRESGIALGILSGGTPRELLRQFDLATNAPQHHGWSEASRAVVTAIRSETVEFRREVVIATTQDGAGAISEDTRVRVFETLSDSTFRSETPFRDFAESALQDQRWSPPWATADWTYFEEAWRKLLVRFYIAGQIAFPRQPQVWSSDELQRLINLTGLSAAVARSIIERGPEEASELEALVPSSSSAPKP